MVVVFVYTAACLQLAARAPSPRIALICTRDHSSDQNKMNEVGAGGAATKAREGSPPPSAHASGVSPVITSLTIIGLGKWIDEFHLAGLSIKEEKIICQHDVSNSISNRLHRRLPLQPPLSLLMRDVVDHLAIPSNSLDLPRLALQKLDRLGLPFEWKHPRAFGR